MEELGGYEFVSGDSTPPNQLACSHCTRLLRDPCIVDCCDAKYCETCVNHLRENGQPCNVCKGQLGNANPNANLQRLVQNQKVYCSRKDSEWKGKLLNLACHEDDQNECPYQPEPPHIMAEVKQMIHSMEEHRKRDRKILILMLSILAVGLSLLFQLMTTTTTKTMEQSLMKLKQEMNSELTTAMKKTEESLISLKQEMNGLKQEMNSELTTEMKKTEKSLIKEMNDLKQEMNGELTTTIKKTEESLMSLKQEMNGKFATMTKKPGMKEKIYREICGGVYIDCKDAYQNGHNTSGVYTINPDNQTEFKVYCDMDTDGGGWTVIQRRFDGSVSFDRNWAECESGFGNNTGEYWLGLSYIHRLTTSASQDMRVDLEDFEGGSAYAHYTTFTVASVTDSYRLLVSGYSGTAGDAIGSNSGQKFTTKDHDNDMHVYNCAVSYGNSPWWYKSCTVHSNLNGKYYSSSRRTGFVDGVNWYSWKVNWYSMKMASMKLRRK